MRDLTAKNTIEINDGISGDVHEIYYRTPTNEERAAYLAGAVQRKGKKILNRVFENRLKFGAKIITGFKKGTIGKDGKAFSCDENDEDYREDWMDLLVSEAGDIVAAVGASVFEMTGAAQAEDQSLPLDE